MMIVVHDQEVRLCIGLGWTHIYIERAVGCLMTNDPTQDDAITTVHLKHNGVVNLGSSAHKDKDAGSSHK